MTKLQFADNFCDNLFANAEVDISDKKVVYKYIKENIATKEVVKYIYYKYLATLYSLWSENMLEDCSEYFSEELI